MSEQEMQMKLISQQEKVNALRQEVAAMNKEREYLKQVRIQAAIAAMDIVKDAYNIYDDIEELVWHSVRIADALVAELKRSENVYAECRRMDAINTAAVCENMTKIQKELQKKGGQDE